MKLKLIHKLLIAMFACAALVLVLITLVTRASIGRGHRFSAAPGTQPGRACGA